MKFVVMSDDQASCSEAKYVTYIKAYATFVAADIEVGGGGGGGVTL